MLCRQQPDDFVDETSVARLRDLAASTLGRQPSSRRRGSCLKGRGRVVEADLVSGKNLDRRLLQVIEKDRRWPRFSIYALQIVAMGCIGPFPSAAPVLVSAALLASLMLAAGHLAGSLRPTIQCFRIKVLGPERVEKTGPSLPSLALASISLSVLAAIAAYLIGLIASATADPNGGFAQAGGSGVKWAMGTVILTVFGALLVSDIASRSARDASPDLGPLLVWPFLIAEGAALGLLDEGGKPGRWALLAVALAFGFPELHAALVKVVPLVSRVVVAAGFAVAIVLSGALGLS